MIEGLAVALTRLCNTSDVMEDAPYRAEIDGFPYAVFQIGDSYFVSEDICSHGPGSLSEGFVEDFEVECPFHQGRFDIRTGAATGAPCWKPIKVWKSVIQDDGVHIDIEAPLVP